MVSAPQEVSILGTDLRSQYYFPALLCSAESSSLMFQVSLPHLPTEDYPCHESDCRSLQSLLPIFPPSLHYWV